MKWILPIFFIIASVGLFVGYIDGSYNEVKLLRAEVQNFDEALKKSKELQALRDALLSRYNTFSSSDLERLEKLLPDNIDNVRLVLELDNIAARYGMRVSNVAISSDVSSGEEGTIGPQNRLYDDVILSFAVSGTYDNFIAFMKDLEKSLRVVDITSLSFDGGPDEFAYNFAVSVRTYWLR